MAQAVIVVLCFGVLFGCSSSRKLHENYLCKNEIESADNFCKSHGNMGFCGYVKQSGAVCPYNCSSATTNATVWPRGNTTSFEAASFPGPVYNQSDHLITIPLEPISDVVSLKKCKSEDDAASVIAEMLTAAAELITEPPPPLDHPEAESPISVKVVSVERVLMAPSARGPIT